MNKSFSNKEVADKWFLGKVGSLIGVDSREIGKRGSRRNEKGWWAGQRDEGLCVC